MFLYTGVSGLPRPSLPRAVPGSPAYHDHHFHRQSRGLRLTTTITSTGSPGVSGLPRPSPPRAVPGSPAYHDHHLHRQSRGLRLTTTITSTGSPGVSGLPRPSPRSFIETAWFLSCTEKKAYLGVVKAWLGSSWRIGQLGKQQNRCFMVWHGQLMIRILSIPVDKLSISIQ